VSRRGDRVRYRWADLGVPDLPSESDFLGEEIAEEGADLPGLTEFLRRRRPMFEGLPVILRVGYGVRYRDVLRVVECAGGDRRVLFRDQTRLHFHLKLTSVREPSVSALLDPEGPEHGDLLLAHPNGTVRRRRKPVTAEDMEFLPRFYADERAPWSACAPFVKAAHRGNLPACFCVALNEPGIGPHHWLWLGPPGDRAVDMRGLPADATVGEVIHAVLRHLKDGAKGFRF
jgi:hypothetical protein